VVAESRVKLAETNVRRVAQAVQAKATSEADLDRAEAEVDSARADIERVHAEVDQAKSRAEQTRVALAKKTIRAPFRARAGLRNVHPGQYLAEGTSVVMLQGIDENIYLDFAVPQEQLFRVRLGDTVLATSAVFGNETVEIKVVSIDATVSPSTRNVRVRGMVKNPNELIRPGMFVDIEVPIGDMVQYTTVPISALRRASYGDHVFVLQAGDKGDLRAKQRFVKIGPILGESVVIADGLTLGEEVATSGSFKLREGLLVNRAPATASGGSPVGATSSPSDQPAAETAKVNK
jgi:membrane fusion protein, multidrug efflux system